MQPTAEPEAKRTRVKAVGQRIENSEELIETFFNNLCDPISIIDTDEFKILLVNKAFLNTYGLEEKDAVGKHCYEVTHHRSKPCEPSEDTCPLKQTLLTGRPHSAVHTNFSGEGGERYVEVTTYPILIEKGKIKKITHIARDITDRVQAERALQASEGRYRRLIESVTDYVCKVMVKDGQPVSTSHGPGCLAVTGYTSEEYEADPYLWYRMIYEEDRQTVLEHANSILKGEKAEPLEHRIIHKNGSIRWIRNTPVVFKDEQGRVVSYDGLISDISERKQAEQGLRESEKKYRQVVENAVEIIYTTDENGNFTYANHAALKVLGYTLEELQRLNYLDLILPDHRQRLKEMYTRQFSEREANTYVEFPFLNKWGKVVWFGQNASLVMEEGRMVGFHVISRDITDRKQAEQEMKTLEEQLRQSQKMEAIGRLAGGVAHDFNNILTVIGGHCELFLRRHREEDPRRDDVKEIKKAADRAANLTRQLLAFSRRQVMEAKVLDLNAILKDMTKMLHRIIGEDIELVMKLSTGLGKVKADPGQIEQVILNLAVNARDAMPSVGKLTVETANAELDEAYARKHVSVKPGRYAMLSMSDTGVGMTSEVKDRVFEPFFTTKGNGTGLGLSTVYGIVKQSGGNIWVYSEPGQGTTFKIYLPQVDESLKEEKKRDVIGELPRGNETVLVVEDEEEVLKLSVEILRRQGYNVLEASEGDDALRICEKHTAPIHLMITDVVMPRMSGTELAKRLGPLHPETRVLYMSGYTDNAIVRHGVLEEGVNYLQKPFTLEKLAEKVREVLDQFVEH